MLSALECFEGKGTSRELAGNHPLALDGPQSVWLVEAGLVDVFAVPMADGEPSGARVHLLRVCEGALLFGAPCIGPAGLNLVAVGTPGSRVRQLDQSRWQEVAEDTAAAQQLSALVDAWVQGLLAGAVSQPLADRATTLSQGEDTQLPSGATVQPAAEGLWLTVKEGSVRLLGREELELEAGDRVIPLARSAWLTTTVPATVDAVPTASVLAEDHLWTGLEELHELVLTCAAANARQRAGDEVLRLERKAASEDQLVQAVLSELAAVVEPTGGDGEVALVEPDPLLAACRLVAERQKITITAPRTYRWKTWSEPVSAIARASEIQTRRVLLSGNWWREDNGPLLGFLESRNEPVAILPRSPSSYEVVDPAAKTRTPVTDDVAKKLKPMAYCFYRAFPPQMLTPRQVLRFSLIGTGREWVSITLLGLAVGLLALLIPISTGWIFSRIIPGAERSQLLVIIMALAVNAVVIALFELGQGIASLRLETKMDSSVEAGVWNHLLNLPASFFRQYTAGDLAMRAMGIGHIRQIITDSAMSTLLTFAFSIVSFGLLFYYNVWLALLSLVVFLVIVGVTCFTAWLQLPYERKHYHLRGRAVGIVLQLLTGVSRLRVAGAERRALSYWAKTFSAQTRVGFQAQSVANASATFMATIPIIGSAVIFSAVVLSPSGSMSLATFLAFNAAFTQILIAAVSTSYTVAMILDVVPLYERAKPILEATPEHHRTKRDPGDLTGDIEVSHVSFRYHNEGAPILEDLSLRAAPGEFIALVGPSGAGKSTVLRLLLGFEKASAGSIYYDREDLAGVDLQAVRRQIGVVLQNNKLTPGDILSNIVGSSTLTLEDAWEAAKLSGLAEDIKRMPMGMHTVISEGESTFSGGQRQRLMIARAVASKPKILLFDEATSALDNITQSKIAKSLESLKVTRIVVAHRLSTIINADRIYVIQRGKVVQQGNYQELTEQGGMFGELARRQLV